MRQPLIALLWTGIVALATLIPATATHADQAAAPHVLEVGVKVAPPFVIDDDGHYRGLAIELWEEAAADHGWKFQYRPYDLEGLLDAVDQGQVDVGLGAITATAAREQRMDFSHILTSSGLGVAVRSDQTAGWLAVVQALVSPAFLKVIGSLSLLLLAIGLCVWLVERRHNPEQFGNGARGVFSGFWWAMVTMTTVGYGDVAPRTVPGRLIGMVWMLTALIVVSFFTASITSALTVGQLSQRVRGVEDLASLRIGSLPDSTSAGWLGAHDLDFRAFGSLDQALQALGKGTIDAVVYDAPLLRYDIQQHHAGRLRVLSLVLARQDYAFALPRGSELRRDINTSLLKRINRSDWNQRLARYLGGTD
jgi:ABC-type amino acid transport substrate-binding protein